MNRNDLAARIHALVEMSEGLAAAAKVLQRQLADLTSGQQELLGLPAAVLTSPGRPNDVVMRVAAILGSALGDVKGRSQKPRHVRARFAAALALHRCSYSQSDIGRILGAETMRPLRTRSPEPPRSSRTTGCSPRRSAGASPWGSARSRSRIDRRTAGRAVFGPVTTPSKLRTALDLASSALDLASRAASMLRRKSPKERADRLRARALSLRLRASRVTLARRKQRMLDKADVLDLRADALDPRPLPGA